jgi:integrase/recombinase XerD
MLTLFRRHLKTCGHRREDRTYRRCHCPIHVEGKLGDDFIRKALGTANWDTAQRRVSEAEGRGSWEELPCSAAPVAGLPFLEPSGEAAIGAPVQVEAERGVTVEQAVAEFLSDAEHGRRLNPKTIEKYELLFRQLRNFAKTECRALLKDFDVTTLRRFREGWLKTRLADLKRDPRPLSARTVAKKTELLKAFFRFAMDSGWIERNPARALKSPIVKDTPKQPFTAEETARIYDACTTVNLKMGTHEEDGPITNDELLTFAMLLRYSGLRIGDAAMLTTDRVQGEKLYLYTQKTGQHVYVPLPPFLCHRLKQVRIRHSKYYFLGPRSGDIDVAAEVWRRKLNRAFVKAGVLHATPHRFRHTFAVELLLRGVPLESVSILLGHNSTRVTERHYAAWVRSRQILLEQQVAKTWDDLQIVEKAG